MRSTSAGNRRRPSVVSRVRSFASEKITIFKKVPQEVLPDKWTPGLISNLGFAPLKLAWQPCSETSRDWDALVGISEDDEAFAAFGVEYKKDA